MKTCVHLYVAELVLERNIKHTFILNTFSENRAVYEKKRGKIQ
jgi:hypothetical protein